MARVKPERLNIYDNLFTLSDFIKMAESEIEKLMKEYNSTVDKIEEINGFILDHKSNPTSTKEIAEKRIVRKTLYNKQVALIRGIAKERLRIKEYMSSIDSKNK